MVERVAVAVGGRGTCITMCGYIVEPWRSGCSSVTQSAMWKLSCLGSR